MTDISRILLFLVSCVFMQNFVFVRLLGGSALLKKTGSLGLAALVGAYTTVVMTVSAALNWVVSRLVLAPLNMASLELIAFVLVVAAVSALVMAAFARISKPFGEAAGEQSAALGLNCAVLGASILGAGVDLGQATLFGLFGGLGFLLAMLLLAGVQERLENSKVPEPLRGVPITLVSASLVALAFMGFIGLA